MSLELPSLDIRVYTLPLDGPEARAAFLKLLHSPGETFIADYGFSQPDLVAEIEEADAAGVAIHMLLDHTQSMGPSERGVLAVMIPLLQHSDVTISTAGPDSASPSQILHTKCMCVAATDGGEPWIWIGSVNFTRPGWLEANQAVVFRSTAYAKVFIDWFERTRDWARAHIPQIAPPLLVTDVVGIAPAIGGGLSVVTVTQGAVQP